MICYGMILENSFWDEISIFDFYPIFENIEGWWLNPIYPLLKAPPFSSKRPQFADGIAKSQSPERGADAASTRELSRSEGHIDLKCRFITSTTKQSQERCFTKAGAWTGAAEVSSRHTDRHWSYSMSDFHAISGII